MLSYHLNFTLRDCTPSVDFTLSIRKKFTRKCKHKKM